MPGMAGHDPAPTGDSGGSGRPGHQGMPLVSGRSPTLGAGEMLSPAVAAPDEPGRPDPRTGRRGRPATAHPPSSPEPGRFPGARASSSSALNSSHP